MDNPDDRAAYEAGYAHGMNPSQNFVNVLQTTDVNAMQTEIAKRGWPSPHSQKGGKYPTWGANQAGLKAKDEGSQ